MDVFITYTSNKYDNEINIIIHACSNSENDLSCFERGIIDGEDYPFNQNTLEQCGDGYYQGFLEGCISVEGSDRNICESATNA
jgi:hypothetical protein